MKTRVPFRPLHPLVALSVILTGMAPGPASAHDGDPAGSAAESGYEQSSPRYGTGYGLAGTTAGTPEDVMVEIEALRKKANKDEPMDEALGGQTLLGTPVHPRTPAYFPSEPRDLFWQMDWVADPATRKLGPLDFDQNGDGKIDEAERDAIRGRNTWLLWGGGNEAFWGWLQERGYGISDFLILMDSRKRESRFSSAGLINQPGFKSNTDKEKRILGLYLDLPADDGSITLRPPAWDETNAEIKDAQGRTLEKKVGIPSLPHGGLQEPFEPGDRAKYENVVRNMAKDGLDYSVYGYPSGIFGLRLMLNPDFFGRTDAAAKARKYWEERVEKAPPGSYYDDPKIYQDPQLVRPFRPSMSCGFCHVGPHPLLPPDDRENPKWHELSSIIGSQYWDPQAAFANLAKPDNFLYHFLKSQAPGTIDTSLVSTDQINNTNVINAIFDVPSRLARAQTKPAEIQAGSNLLFLGKPITDPPVPVQCPMVLFPGEDSVGMIPALARVPLNIGVFSELWARSDNPFIGFTAQRPFSVATCRTNSVYWMVNERYRVPYMAAFFTHGTPSAGGEAKVVRSTDAMRLRDAVPVIEKPPSVATAHLPSDAKTANQAAAVKPPESGEGGAAGTKGGIESRRDEVQFPFVQKVENGIAISEGAKEFADADFQKKYNDGRDVFLDNCAICHSSKQPTGFHLVFQREMEGGWANSPVPRKLAETDPDPLPVYTLPMTYDNWEAFRRPSPALKDYRARIRKVAGQDPEDWRTDPFIKDNFLSNELRIPATLVGTNAGRALASNGMRDNVWNDFSSESFKTLPSVGKIRFFDIFAKGAPDRKYGTNAEFDDGRRSGGPGYMRPPSLISVWATGPYFHNNALGLYNHNPSFAGRKEAFYDGARKLLNNSRRPAYTVLTATDDYQKGRPYAYPGDLRAQGSPSAQNDPGYIYRLPQDTHVKFAAGFIPFLIKGIAGQKVFSFLSLWVWIILVALLAAVAWYGSARHAGFLFLLSAVALGALLALTGIAGAGGTVAGAMTMAAATGMSWSGWALWLIPVGLVVLGFWLSFTKADLQKPVRLFFLGLTLLTVGAGILANKFLNGRLKDRHPLIAVLPNGWIDGDYKGISFGPIPRGMPVDLMMNLDPAKKDKLPQAVASLAHATVLIKKRGLTGDAAWELFEREAGPALLAASKSPDFVLDRGHWFGEELTSEDKENLIAFLKTL